jgi:hypothetical protein
MIAGATGGRENQSGPIGPTAPLAPRIKTQNRTKFEALLGNKTENGTLGSGSLQMIKSGPLPVISPNVDEMLRIP